MTKTNKGTIVIAKFHKMTKISYFRICAIQYTTLSITYFRICTMRYNIQISNDKCSVLKMITGKIKPDNQ